MNAVYKHAGDNKKGWILYNSVPFFHSPWRPEKLEKYTKKGIRKKIVSSNIPKNRYSETRIGFKTILFSKTGIEKLE